MERTRPPLGPVSGERNGENTRILKKGPGNVIRQFPRERACDDCNEYSAHMTHGGLVYHFFYDENGD